MDNYKPGVTDKDFEWETDQELVESFYENYLIYDIDDDLPKTPNEDFLYNFLADINKEAVNLCASDLAELIEKSFSEYRVFDRKELIQMAKLGVK